MTADMQQITVEPAADGTMLARAGDWIVVESGHVGEPRRRCLVIGLQHADGSPPYLVRWTDGHEAILAPGSDAHVERPAGAA